MKNNKELISKISSAIISIILIDLGLAIISSEKYIGIITILMGLVLLYFTYYSFQIRINEAKIK